MKTALVTGANRGIGLAIAAGLNRSGGIKILVASRRAEDAENAVKTLGGNTIPVQLDLSKRKIFDVRSKTSSTSTSPSISL